MPPEPPGPTDSTAQALRRGLGDIRRRIKLIGRSDDTAALQRLFRLLREPARRPGAVTWRNRLLRYADAPALYHQLADIYAERAYDFTCDRTNPCILDVGGHIGLAALRFRELFPAAEITTFEPDPTIVELLRQNLAAAGDTATTVIAAAAGTSEGTARFAASGDASGMLASDGGLTVPTVDLARHCTTRVDFLKLDVEGAEFELVAHLVRTKAIVQVQRLCIELHQWTAAAPRFHELIVLLADAGFNYRLRSAVALGAKPHPAGFVSLAHPANLVALYAWRHR